MNVKKKRIIYLFITIFIFISYIPAQEQDKLVEEVDVVNVMVPVRVFYKGEPVKGLKKEDFKILVNGKKTAIHGFFEKTQKISVEKPFVFSRFLYYFQLFLSGIPVPKMTRCSLSCCWTVILDLTRPAIREQSPCMCSIRVSMWTVIMIRC